MVEPTGMTNSTTTPPASSPWLFLLLLLAMTWPAIAAAVGELRVWTAFLGTVAYAVGCEVYDRLNRRR